MFAFKTELVGLMRKDPLATDEEKHAAIALVEGREENACIRFREAAQKLGLCRHSVYKLVKNGALNGVKGTGKRPYAVTAESLKEYMRESRRTQNDTGKTK